MFRRASNNAMTENLDKNSGLSRFSRSLSLRQARAAVFTALVLGIAFSALQIGADLRNEQQKSETAFAQSLMAFEDSAFQAAYGLDEILARTVVQGLFQQAAIFEAKIVDNFGQNMAIAERPQRQGALKWLADGIFGKTRTYAIELRQKQSGFHAGDLSIRVDNYVIAETFFQRSGLILLFGLLRNLILAVILAALFHKMLTKPLRLMADRIKASSGDVETPPSHESDELGDMINAHNELLHQRADAERRFRDFAEIAADWFWELDDQLRFTFVSKNISMIGSKPEFFIGRSSEEIVAGSEVEAAWAEEINTLKQHLPLRNSAKPSVINPERWVQSDGEPLFDSDGRFTGYRGTTVDITERKLAQEALAQSNERYQALAEGSIQGVYVHKNFIPLYANEALVRIFGLESVDHFLGTESVLDLVHEDDVALIKERARKRYAGEYIPQIIEYRGVRADGATIWLQSSGQAIQWDGEDAILIMLIDVTKRRHLEAQIRHAQKMEAVGQLTGGIAHDFNNILGIIMGNLQLLQRQGEDDPELMNYAETALESVRRGAEITKKLLGFSRHAPGTHQVVAANEFITGLEGLIAKSLTASISVETHLADEAWPVEIDVSDFENAILNLSLNARDAMPEGGKLRIETANTALEDAFFGPESSAKPGPFVMISVSDNGTGMSAEVREKIFEPFFTTKRFGQGSGLGLSMVYGFVERSGGHINVQSEVGEGTTFQIYLPRAKTAVPEDGMAVEEPLDLPGGSETILVVDDEDGLLQVAMAYLEDLGYVTLGAHDGQEALNILQGRNDIDLLFTDVIMPGDLDGYQTALAARKRNPSLDVLLTSGFTKSRDHQECINDNNEAEYFENLMQNILTKPYKRQELALAIRQTLEGKD